MGLTFPQPSTTTQEQLLARLADDKTADALNRILDRLEVVAFVAEAQATSQLEDRKSVV